MDNTQKYDGQLFDARICEAHHVNPSAQPLASSPGGSVSPGRRGVTLIPSNFATIQESERSMEPIEKIFDHFA
jgi:hypothetical protein